MTRPICSRYAGILRDLLAVALLWALVLAFFWRIALAGRVLAGGDVFTYFYPYWAEATRVLQAGRLPLWNPYLFMGAPFLANSQVGVFYPLNWPLWLLLPAHRSVHLTIVLHLCLAALNAYLWGRGSLRLGRLGAWTVGAIFAMGGYLGAQVEHVNQLQGLAWLPLILALYDRSLRPDRKSQIGKSANQQIGKSANQQISNLRIRDPRSAFSILHSPFSIALAVVLALVLLAGHTQTAFISLVGLAAYGLAPALWRAVRSREWGLLGQRVLHLVVVSSVGLVLAAVQLLPTWELSRLSLRAQGLPFNERVSFSLSPLYLARAFLPNFAAPVPPEHIEHVAYVGIAALSLAALSLSHWHPGPRTTEHGTRTTYRAPRRPVILLLMLGLFLSIGLYNPLYLLLARFVPGFAHFRVPARWLVLAVLGLAALAGWGAETLYHRHRRVNGRTCAFLALALILLGVWAALGGYRAEGEQVAGLALAGWAAVGALAVGLLLATARVPRLATLGLLALLVIELWAAGLALPYSRATAPQAFTSLRPAIAHLLAAEQEAGPASRFLSMSDITFDPGDLAEIEVIYGPQLSAEALYDLIVAAKHKEVLSPNLPLAFGIPAVDGYDGGVLPLARYAALQRLLLPADQVSMDGRLRENLAAIPDGRWLNLFNVRHVVTDKLRDAWLDGVFYDLQWGAQLGPGQVAAVAHVPRFEATALGIVSYLRGAAALSNGALVGEVEVGLGDGITRTFQLRAGEQTAEGLYDSRVGHAQATVGGHFWPGQPEGNDYVARLRWPEPAAPVAVVVRAFLPQGELVVRGVSLIDERTGGFQALLLSDRGRFRLAHSGDVKIYENLDVLGRAFLVHQAAVVPEDQAALVHMQDPAFDPALQVVLSEGEDQVNDAGIRPGEGKSARVAAYTPERVEVEVAARTPAYLVLSDAWYPGWRATVDGVPVPIRRADLLFRAVAVPAGTHRVLFTFRPASLYVGAGLSLAGLAGLGVAVAFALSKARRNAIIGTEHVEHSEEGKR